MQEKFKKRLSGSLCIYFTLLLACTGAFILAVVEIARFSGLDADASEYTNLAEESLFAGYQPVLLKEYDMFWLDGCFGEESFSIAAGEAEMEALLYDNLRDRARNYYRMQVEGVTAETYLLATDREGKVFQSQAAAAYRERFGEIAAEEILSRIKGIQDTKNRGENPEEKISPAEATLESIQKQAAQEAAQQTSGDSLTGGANGKAAPSPMVSPRGENLPAQSGGNPLEANRKLRSCGVLSLVLPSGAVLSEKRADTKNCLFRRSCKKGTDREAFKTGTMDRIFMQQYIKRYGGNYLEPKVSGGLSYGEEYVIAGKASDRENLEYVVKELLLVREIANFAYLATDGAKQAEALTMATTLAGISGNPALIEVVKQGILAVWAYGESICDVKILLSGGKVPLMKTAADWNTDLSHIGDVVSGNYGEAGHGLCYEEYLQAFMYALSTKKASCRCMDLMEFTMEKSGYKHAKMDGMILRMKIQAEYSADTIFCGLLGEDTLGGYSFEKEGSYCYR